MPKKVNSSKKKKGAQKPEKEKLEKVAVIRALVAACKKDSTDETKESFYSIYSKYIRQELSNYESFEKYNILFLLDNTTIIKGDSDNLYKAIKKLPDNKKPLLLVLLSRGGEAGPAYLIGKLCREYSNDKFVVAIPRHAKSAATLIACGADEIHMGSLSELGPIDPQINRMPTLGLKNSIEHIADLVKKYPESAKMFSQYLQQTIEPIQIGYYERVAKSAMQYAERLLESHKKTVNSKEPLEIAEKLVYGYQDHGFVIDKAEACSVFGENIVKSNTSEYQLADTAYVIFSQIEDIANEFNYGFYFIGNLDSSPNLLERKRR